MHTGLSEVLHLFGGGMHTSLSEVLYLFGGDMHTSLSEVLYLFGGGIPSRKVQPLSWNSGRAPRRWSQLFQDGIYRASCPLGHYINIKSRILPSSNTSISQVIVCLSPIPFPQPCPTRNMKSSSSQMILRLPPPR